MNAGRKSTENRFTQNAEKNNNLKDMNKKEKMSQFGSYPKPQKNTKRGKNFDELSLALLTLPAVLAIILTYLLIK